MGEPTGCLICERIAMIAAGTSPWFVAELETGYVVLGDHQFFRGYTLLLGNAEPHLHWHLFPRHADDPRPGGPPWLVDRTLRYGEAARPTPEALRVLKHELLAELRRQPELRIVRSWED